MPFRTRAEVEVEEVRMTGPVGDEDEAAVVRDEARRCEVGQLIVAGRARDSLSVGERLPEAKILRLMTATQLPRAEDVAATVCFLVSGAAAQITGQVVYLTAGEPIV
jgi:NAD(P)-dependent dehydrogenase (short-subunit alcohol dehydrogenase family)